jgi:Rieske Fe-S protein
MNHDDRLPDGNDSSERRSFLTRSVAAVTGLILALFPFAAGLGVALHPLFRRGKPKNGAGAVGAPDFVRVCPLDSLPADGLPHEFVVTADVSDAWTRLAGQRIGSVFLTRANAGSQPQLTAFTATCPHLGCAVEYDASQQRFECPCHESGFAKDGQKLFGPSLRGLDPLEVRLVDDSGAQEVWVEFKRFRAGVAERIPTA